MSKETPLFCLFGNPVEHSLSPLMHNAAYREMGLPARYVAFRVSSPEEALRTLRDAGAGGASVTLPFKTAIMPHLDGVDEDSRAIGAVNTLRLACGKVEGRNTDWVGFNRALAKHFEIRGKTVAVLGSSGAARAAVFGIRREGGTAVVVSRNPETGAALARDFDCPFLPLSDFKSIRAHCLVNATPVGMGADAGKALFKREDLGRFEWVMDMVYNPVRTGLLREAQAAGCGVITGVPMLVLQGAEQIRIWTGMEPPVGLMTRVVEEELACRCE
jgi:shikimate dehydrogenase